MKLQPTGTSKEPVLQLLLVTCSDGGVLGKGSTSYKCRSCGKTVNDHTRQCAMKTTLGNETEITENIAELKKTSREYEK